MSKDFPAWRRGHPGKSRREEKLHSLLEAGLYYWKFGVLWYFILLYSSGGYRLLLSWEAAMVILDGAEVETGLENLAKHRARRLVYYCMFFYRHAKRSTDESRRR